MMSSEPVSLGERLKQRRINARLEQEKLIEDTGLQGNCDNDHRVLCCDVAEINGAWVSSNIPIAQLEKKPHSETLKR
jgi:transcriptional regulator with XRE-family HTH domain